MKIKPFPTPLLRDGEGFLNDKNEYTGLAGFKLKPIKSWAKRSTLIPGRADSRSCRFFKKLGKGKGVKASHACLLKKIIKGIKMRIKFVHVFSFMVLSFFLVLFVVGPVTAGTDAKQTGASSDANAFVQAARKGDIEAVTSALKNGTDPNVKDKEGNTALIEAAKEGRKDVAALLIDKGADVNEGDARFGGTPLIWAALNGKTEMVGMLLEKGANLSAREKLNGLTPLLAAAVKGNTETVKFLLDKGASVHSKDGEGRTALMWAANAGRLETVKLLLDKGATLEATEEEKGMTALITAAMMGRTETVQLLLDHGADIEKKDKNGRTALMWAAQYGRADTVELLLNKGASLKAEDNRGNTALSLTKSSKIKDDAKKKVEELLSKHMPPEKTGS